MKSVAATTKQFSARQRRSKWKCFAGTLEDCCIAVSVVPRIGLPFSEQDRGRDERLEIKMQSREVLSASSTPVVDCETSTAVDSFFF